MLVTDCCVCVIVNFAHGSIPLPTFDVFLSMELVPKHHPAGSRFRQTHVFLGNLFTSVLSIIYKMYLIFSGILVSLLGITLAYRLQGIETPKKDCSSSGLRRCGQRSHFVFSLSTFYSTRCAALTGTMRPSGSTLVYLGPKHLKGSCSTHIGVLLGPLGAPVSCHLIYLTVHYQGDLGNVGVFSGEVSLC